MRFNASMIGVALIVAPCVTSGDDFETCVASDGAVYVAARDRLLSSGELDAVITSNLESQDVKVKTVAKLLRAWKANSREYHRLENAETVRSLNGNLRFIWASDPRQIRPSLAPLALEFLIKDSAGEPGRHAAVRIVPYLLRREVPQDLEVLTDVFIDERTKATNRLAIAQVFERLPESTVGTASVLQLLDSESERSDASTDAASSLLNALVSRSPDLDGEQRNSTVDKLLRNEAIQKTVGRKPVVPCVGGVGGTNALPVVTEFFAASKDEGDRRWAISTIASFGTADALKTLQGYMTTDDISPELRIEAVRGLGRSSYSDGVRDRLKDIFYNDESPRSREEALHSLEALMNRAKVDDAKDSIKEIIRGVDANSLKDIKFRKSFDSTIERIDR